MSKLRKILLSVILAFSFTAGVVADPPAVVNPEVNDGPILNPLKGFHIGFFESCCGGNPNENYFGNFMATIGYQNFSWAELEPDDDDWNWDFVDEELSDRAGSAQKQVIVQLNAEWTRGDRSGRTPQWFLDDDRFEENLDLDEFGNVEYRSHKYDSEFYQEEVKEFIAEFINRFKDDPRIFIIQMGMVGYFGEFNVFPNDDEWLPENIKTMFFEHYRDHIFGRVERDADDNLVVVEDGSDGAYSAGYNGYSALTQARYPDELGYNIPTDGIGYTNGWVNIDGIADDGINDDDIGNKDFNDPIDEIVTDDGRKLWELGPVGGEWPPNRYPEGYEDPDNPFLANEGVIEEWTSFWGAVPDDDGALAGEDYIERGHYSFARPPKLDTIAELLGYENWSLVPDDWNTFLGNAEEIANNYSTPGGDLFRKWHRMMGYNYQLSNIQHYFSASQSRINISFDVTNVGLAPFYQDWNVEFAILDSGNNVVQLIPVNDTDMRNWKTDEPTNVSASAALSFDITQPVAEYRIGLRMSQPGATAEKDALWKLDARNTYIVISNDVDVIDGQWRPDIMNTLQGGWNVLANIDIESTCSSCETDAELCFPVISANNNIAMICL